MGLALAIISAFIATAKDMTSKWLSGQLDGTASTFASFAFALPYYLLILFAGWIFGFESFAWSGAFLSYVLLRSVSDAGAEWTKMQALSLGDLSLVAPLISLAPLFLLGLSPILTGDPLSTFGVVAVLLSVSGSLIVVTGPREVGEVRPKKAILLSLATSFCFALNVCFDRMAVQLASPLLSGFAMTAIAALFFLPTMFVSGRWRQAGMNFRLLSVRGLLEVAFMVTKLSALVYLPAPSVAALTRVSLLLSIVGGRVMFKEEEFGRRLLAGLLIVGGALLVIWS